MILKSDGASLYTTTDLATSGGAMKDYHPDEIIYVVDKRQEMHFIQVFRCARKTGIVDPDTELNFLGFGTMNGKDGKPFKTREGGVMRLEKLIRDIDEEMYQKIMDNQEMSRRKQERPPRSWAFPPSSTAIFPTRPPRIMSSMWTASLPSREIPAPISCTRSSGSSRF